MIKTVILIVDDKVENLNLFQSILQNRDYSIYTSSDSNDAVTICKAVAFDLILMDIRMPVDGFETFERIKKTSLNPDVPVIYIAEKTDLESISEAYKRSCRDVITKPFQIGEVLSKISIHASLQSQQKQLRELISGKDKFNSILAHDLKSPISALLGLSGALAKNIRSYDIDKIENLVNYIHKSAISTFNLLEDLLLWARTQSGKMPYNPQQLDLFHICDNVLEILDPYAKEKNIKINYSAAGNVSVFADEEMLKTILRNLVSNAIKFSFKHGVVNIHAEENPEHIMISISDKGIGIAPLAFAELFDVSHISSTFGTEGEKGTGFGLLLCKEFVEMHGGKIWAESEVGKGSDLMLTLPKRSSSFGHEAIK